MPTYEYKNLKECSNEKCDRNFECVHSVSEVKSTLTCSVCSCEVSVSKVYGVTPVHYKGSGFYVTDNKKPDAVAKKNYYPRTSDKKYY